MQGATPLWNSSFPLVFLKENDHFDPSPRKIFRLRRALKHLPPLLGGAARPKPATLTVTIIHAWSGPVVDVPGVMDDVLEVERLMAVDQLVTDGVAHAVLA